MKTPINDDLIHDLFSIVKKRIELGLNYDVDSGVDPATSGRLDAEIIFNALDWCKGPLAKHFDVDEENLYSRTAPLHGTDWATESKVRHGWGMLEYLIDFSISHGAIPMAIGQGDKQLPDGVKFELLLGAESELGTNVEVCRDLLKLLDVRCRVKVMLFVARSSPAWIEKLKSQMERVLNSHANSPADSAWLFIGVPSFVQWCNYAQLHGNTPRQVYVLGRNGGSYCLVDKSDWWKL